MVLRPSNITARFRPRNPTSISSLPMFRATAISSHWQKHFSYELLDGGKFTAAINKSALMERQ